MVEYWNQPLQYRPYHERDGRGYYDRPVTFQEPIYTDYRRDYGRSSSSYNHGRYGVVPLEEIYGRQEAPGRWMNQEYPRGHGGDQHVYRNDDRHDQHHNRKRVELWVPMCCDKCERKVKKHLQDMEGADSVTTDQWTKKVVVVGNVRADFVLSRVRRDKAEAEFWSARHRE